MLNINEMCIVYFEKNIMPYLSLENYNNNNLLK